ncbi:response regulator [Marinicrinis lubricantis]|uniref:Response regulator n=1 Tax=Marinicrinis lubricantis TaxID=2086470 RepID=A0ABW1IPB3_9BACL
MYRIVLIEDEPPILQMAKILIESFQPGFEVSGCAYNGEDGMALIREQNPDVVITDIRMPMMDGLTLIRELSAEQPDIEWVILSGYAEFDYAVKALELGVSDYILKPIDPAQLKKVLEKLAVQLEQKRELHMREWMLRSFREGDFPEEGASWFQEEVYCPILLVAGNLASNLHDPMNPGKDFFGPSFLDRLRGLKPEAVRSQLLVEGLASNQKLLLLGGGRELEEEEMVDPLLSLLEEKETGSIPLHVFVGRSITSIHDVPDSIQALISSSHSRLHIGKSEVVRMFVEEESPMNYTEDKGTCDRLIRETEFTIFQQELLSWARKWQERAYSQARVEWIFNRIVEGFHARMNQLAIDSWDLQELFAAYTDDQDLIHAFLQLVQDAYFADAQHMDGAKSTSADLAEEISVYLQSRFDTPISYDDLQEKFGYHKDYLAQLFRQRFHMSPNKYLVQLRIEHAKQLMSVHADLPLKEIAARVGYEDPLYFSKVFKSLEGMSPSKFRERLISGSEVGGSCDVQVKND